MKGKPTRAITGLNTLLYSTEVEALHAVMRDVFDLPQEDVDPDWIHFDCPPTRMELHPGQPDFGVPAGDRITHAVSLICDDMDTTVEELQAKGVEFLGEPRDVGWGKVIIMVLPGGVEMVMYQPGEE